MIFKRRFYILAIVLVVFFVTVMIAFFVQKDDPENFKGTLVKCYSQEAVF